MNAPEILTDDGAGQQLVKSVSIENLVNQRAAVIEKIEAGLELLREAYQLSLAAHVGFPRFKIDESKYDIGNVLNDRHAEVSANIQKIVDRGAWVI